jgi:hypothetical protein
VSLLGGLQYSLGCCQVSSLSSCFSKLFFCALKPLTSFSGGKIFLQANWGTQLLQVGIPLPARVTLARCRILILIFLYRSLQLPSTEIPLPDIPHAVRTYPASAATAMLPLTPANKYTATVLFCGGGNYASDEWENPVSYYKGKWRALSIARRAHASLTVVGLSFSVKPVPIPSRAFRCHPMLASR